MTDLRTAAQQALEALDAWKDASPSQWTTYDEKTITALKAALEQPEQKSCKRHNPCERLPDGYCARCHSEMYP